MDTPRPFPATNSPPLAISRTAIQREMSEHQHTSQNPVGSTEAMCLAPRPSPHPTWPCVNKGGCTPHLEADHLALSPPTLAAAGPPSACLRSARLGREGEERRGGPLGGGDAGGRSPADICRPLGQKARKTRLLGANNSK